MCPPWLRNLPSLTITEKDIHILLDHICSESHHQRISCLWCPFLPDVKNDMVLELAAAAGAQAIVTCNTRNFEGVQEFGLRVLTAKEFLEKIGELK